MTNTVTVMINGAPFGFWTTASINIQFDTASNEATVSMSERPRDPLPVRLNDPAVVLIDGEPVVTGFVDDIDGDHGFQDHRINITIRDKTQDLIESTIGPKQEHKPPISLKKVCEKTIEQMELEIAVKDFVNPSEFRPSEKVAGQIDVFGHDHLKNWANKRQCVLNTDGKGNLQIDRNRKRLFAGALFKAFEDSPQNNILASRYRNSSKNRANTHKAAGQKSPTDRHWEGRPKDDAPAQANPISTNVGEAKDTAMRPSRRIHYRGRQAIEGETPQKAAAWKANLARAHGVTYEARVQGFYGAGQLWWPGYLVPVFDAHWELAATMFIKGVSFEKSFEGGSITVVSCTVEDAFTENASEQPKSGERGAQKGLGHSAPGRFDPVSGFGGDQFT